MPPKLVDSVKRGHGTLRPAKATLAYTPTGPGECPTWFDAEQRTEWQRIVGDAEMAAVLAPAHRPTLIHHCILFKRLLEDAQGTRKLTATERQSFLSVEAGLGFTPTSAAKVPRPKTLDPDDPWERLAGGGPGRSA
jgi:phage terminase small subunit